ncbi:fimbrial protein [Dryocola sp. BD626]|uniref:fimbrial protein n=1 Tax=Dryocola sp. BD626 TaxID=3133273 RepID=UPI003F50B69B
MAMGNKVCVTTSKADSTGILKVGAGVTYQMGVSESYLGEFREYVPIAGTYTARLHICPTTSSSRCTISNSTETIDGVKSFKLSSSKTIYQQQPSAGGANRTVKISYTHTMCLSLVDDHGIEWASKDGMSCQDGHKLPDTPATCYLNFGDTGTLSVDMGTLERGSMATAPQSTQTVKKSISVLCTRDAGVNANYHFEYTPSPIAGEELVSTNLNGVAIALIDDGKIVTPSYKKDVNFSTGYSYINLEFGAVRDPIIKLDEIATGKFTANAVLVMNIQ